MLSSGEWNQEEANPDQMELVFQQVHVVLETKGKCGWGQIQSSGFHKPAASGESLKFQMLGLGGIL